MSEAYFWTIIFGLSLGTFIVRASFILVLSKVNISKRIEEIFSFIPAAILPAIVTPLAFFHQGEVQLLFGKERLLILILGIFVFYKSKNMLVTILFGLVLLYGLTQV